MNLSRSSVFLLIAAPLLGLVGDCYGAKGPVTDWDQYFKEGVAPQYPYEARLVITDSHDQHYSYTDSNGETQSWHCSASEQGARCADGSGLSFWLVQSNGIGYYVSGKLWTYDDPWILTFEPDFILAKMFSHDSFHFRFVRRGEVDLACIQQPGTESIPNGKPRKDYAKHHRLESCYQAGTQAIHLGSGWN